MPTSPYTLGEVVRLSVAITDLAGAAADPGVLRLKVKAPAGAVTTYTYGGGAEVVKDSAGHYHADIALAAAGTWSYRWESDAPNPGAAEGALTVQKSRVV